MLKKSFFSATITLLLLCVLVEHSQAKEARLSDIIVTNTRDYLLVYFSVTDCFTDEMNKAILNGIPTKFTFFVKLHEEKSGWFDQKLADINLTHTIEYNTLKNEFKLSLAEQNTKVVTTKDFDEAKKLMSEVVALQISRLNKLKRGSQYKLRIKAELDKIELPFYLDYVLFFLSLWDFETDWYSVVFRY